MRVSLRAAEPYESTSANPLGADHAQHRIWSWADGSWLLLKFLDDGATIATTSPGLTATLLGEGDRLIVRVAGTAGGDAGHHPVALHSARSQTDR